MKKKYIIWSVLAIVLILCFAFAKGFISLNMRSLQRENDTEFAQGSNIQNQKLSNIQIESLYKLCKVWGYTKYYHPAVISGELNWDAELFRVMPDILESKTSDKANEVLINWLETFPVKMEQVEQKKIGRRFKKKQANRYWIQRGSKILHF